MFPGSFPAFGIQISSPWLCSWKWRVNFHPLPVSSATGGSCVVWLLYCPFWLSSAPCSYKITKGFFFPFACECHSVQTSALYTVGWLHSGQPWSQGFVPMSAQCWGTVASLRIKLISLGLALCLDLSGWSWVATGQHGGCSWHAPSHTAPCGGAQGVSWNSTELPGLVPPLPLVSALKKMTDALVLGNGRTENPAKFQCLPRIKASLTEIFSPLDLP